MWSVIILHDQLQCFYLMLLESVAIAAGFPRDCTECWRCDEQVLCCLHAIRKRQKQLCWSRHIMFLFTTQLSDKVLNSVVACS